MEMKQYDLAIADFTRAIQMNPGDGDLYWGRYLARKAKGDTVQAEADKRRAGRQHRDTAPAQP